jgi:hypothetical protein
MGVFYLYVQNVLREPLQIIWHLFCKFALLPYVGFSDCSHLVDKVLKEAAFSQSQSGNQNFSIPIGGIKYQKSTIRNQSIIQKYFSSPMGPQRVKMKKKHVLKKVGFSKPVR